MGNRQELERSMPALLTHEGVWEGIYQIVDVHGRLTDEHRSRVECVFPDHGPFHYVQRNHFEWEDGRVYEVEFGGTLDGDRVVWDVETFAGHAWVTAGDVILLQLDRKDEPGATFTEIIVPGADGETRARTWHWFRDGTLYQRTLCNERRSTE